MRTASHTAVAVLWRRRPFACRCCALAPPTVCCAPGASGRGRVSLCSVLLCVYGSFQCGTPGTSTATTNWATSPPAPTTPLEDHALPRCPGTEPTHRRSSRDLLMPTHRTSSSARAVTAGEVGTAGRMVGSAGDQNIITASSSRSGRPALKWCNARGRRANDYSKTNGCSGRAAAKSARPAKTVKVGLGAEQGGGST